MYQIQEEIRNGLVLESVDYNCVKSKIKNKEGEMVEGSIYDTCKPKTDEGNKIYNKYGGDGTKILNWNPTPKSKNEVVVRV